MKKGTVITRVTIEKGDKVTAYAKIRNGAEFVLPLTRNQRMIFIHWGKEGRFDDIRKEFGNNAIIDESTFKRMHI